MTTPAILLAAMVIRLGGKVELTAKELVAAEGLMLTPGENGIVIEANIDPEYGALEEGIVDE